MPTNKPPRLNGWSEKCSLIKLNKNWSCAHDIKLWEILLSVMVKQKNMFLVFQMLYLFYTVRKKVYKFLCIPLILCIILLYNMICLSLIEIRFFSGYRSFLIHEITHAWEWFVLRKEWITKHLVIFLGNYCRYAKKQQILAWLRMVFRWIWPHRR